MGTKILMNDAVRAHLAAIDAARSTINASMNEIRKHRQVLIDEVVVAYNKISEPIDGVTVESRGVILGFQQCKESPIGVCVYASLAHEVMSIPGQLEILAREKEKGTYLDVHDLEKLSAATGTNACLFCGAPGDVPDRDGA